MEERERIVEAIRDMSEVYGRKMSPSALQWWATMWEPYDYSRLRIAMQQVANTSDFMPSIRQLKRAVSHLCPTALSQQVFLQWQQNGGSGIPTQQEIDSILVEMGKSPGEVTRKLLLPR